MHKFHQSIKGKEKISVIAEIKKRSPSHGRFEKYTPQQLIQAYHQGGATAISVVTEPEFFEGSLELLNEIHSLTTLPIIRKDFILNFDQIAETAAAGASAILLIADKLSQEKLEELIVLADHYKLDPLVEIHSNEDLQKIRSLKPDKMPDFIIGINNRNLHDFKLDVKHALKFIEQIQSHFGRQQTIIAESGFHNAEDLKPYLGKIDAVLIGTSLLTSNDPSQKLTTFTHAGSTQK